MENKILNPRIYKTISKDKKNKKNKVLKNNIKKDKIEEKTTFRSKTLLNNSNFITTKKTNNKTFNNSEKKENLISEIKQSNINNTTKQTSKTKDLKNMLNEISKVYENNKNDIDINTNTTEKINITKIKNNEEKIKSEISNNINKKISKKLSYNEYVDKIDIKTKFDFEEYNKKDGELLNNIKEENYKKLNRLKNNNFNNITIEEKLNSKSINNNPKNKSKKTLMNVIKLSVCAFFIFVIFKVSFQIENLDDIDILNVFSNEEEISVINNFDLNIAIDSLDQDNNLLVNEMNKQTFEYLLTINTDYTINYNLLESVEKIDGNIYNLKIKDENYTSDIIEGLENSKDLNIKNIDQTDSTNIIVTLKSDNPYFVYSLKDIFVENKYNTNNYIKNVEDDQISFVKNSDNNSIVENINIINYDDSNDIIDDFKSEKINMFFTSSEEELNLIGRYDYNIDKYKTGENYFLLFNKESDILSNYYIRKAIAYAIDRNEIVSSLSKNFTEIIDIPYLFSEVSFKYDSIASENLLIENGYEKVSGIYQNDDGSLILELLVNEDDAQKIIIADEIKLMLETIGIRVNVEKLSSEEIETKVGKDDYDMVLSTIYLNESADISFIYDYININDNVNTIIEEIEDSTVEELPNNIELLMQTISNEVACIGIVSKTSAVIYDKDIEDLGDLKYMNLLNFIIEN